MFEQGEIIAHDLLRCLGILFMKGFEQRPVVRYDLLHAIADALLGAASLGDIGECFPDTDPKYKNIASKIILSRVMKMITGCGLVLQHVDTTVIVQKPNLKKYKDRIKRKVAGILNLKPSQVNIKAKTKEELESEGSGFSISAFAVVTLIKT